jgi:2-succinyl-5-enolpyruvyl-6-hydroxy-3-cyclohexene-1-carboxylate synthase
MTATDTYLLLRAFCDELARCGIEHACTSPGSRCTPIVLSLVRERRIRCWSHIDERCAGFFALGAAKASGRPVAITCTSGTAAANLAPAVIEAFQARVPLIVLTADRPAELREVGAGKTIDQLKLYGDAVKWFFEVGVGEATPERLRWIRQLACRAYLTAIERRAGPVHLNLPLREPLVLSGELPFDDTGRPDERPWVSGVPTAIASPLPGSALPARGVIVAGRQERDRDLGHSVARFAERVGYPLLADATSGARHGPAVVARYDLLLRHPGFAQRARPELIIRVGDLPTSKALRGWLGSLYDVDQIALDPEDAWQDPAAVVTWKVHSDPGRTLDAWSLTAPLNPDWLASWRAADDGASAAIATALGDQLSEPLIAARLSDWLGAEATLFVASGLLAARRLDLPLTIVLLNNDGGGIFHFLPVAGQADAFEPHVATPHGLEFRHAAELYGCRYERPGSVDALKRAIERAIAGDSVTIVEVGTDREQNLALHRRIQAAVLEALPEY